jgi:hypothetical protein
MKSSDNKKTVALLTILLCFIVVGLLNAQQVPNSNIFGMDDISLSDYLPKDVTYNPDIPTPLDTFFKGGKKREALNKMNVVNIQIKTLVSELVSLQKQIKKQREYLKGQQGNYEIAVKKYMDVATKFSQQSAETYSKFDVKKKTVGQYKTNIDLPIFKEDPKSRKIMMKTIKDFEKIEKYVDEMLKKDEYFRQGNVKTLEYLDQKRNEVRYLDQQFMNISKLKKEFIDNKSKKYEAALEDLYKMIIEINTTGKRKINTNLTKTMDGLENLYDKLYQEKREHLKYLMKSIEQLRVDIKANMELESQVQKVASDAIQKFFNQEPSQSFKLDFQQMIRSRNQLKQNIDLIKDDIISIRDILEFMQKNKQDVVAGYLEEVAKKGYERLPNSDRIKGTGADTKIKYDTQAGTYDPKANKPKVDPNTGGQGNKAGQPGQPGKAGQYANKGDPNKRGKGGDKGKNFRGNYEGVGGGIRLSTDTLDHINKITGMLIEHYGSLVDNDIVYARLNKVESPSNNEYNLQYTLESKINNKNKLSETYKISFDRYDAIERYYYPLLASSNDLTSTSQLKWNDGTEFSLAAKEFKDASDYKCNMYYNNIYDKLGLLKGARKYDFGIFLPRTKTSNLYTIGLNNPELNKKLDSGIDMVMCPFQKRPILPNSLYYLNATDVTGNLVNMITGLSLDVNTGNYDENNLINQFGFEKSLI